MKLMVKASHIASFLGVALSGPDIWVTGACSSRSPEPEKIGFCTPYMVSLGILGRIKEFSKRNPFLLLAPLGVCLDCCSVLNVENPRLAFARVIAKFFSTPDDKGIAPTAIIKNCVRVGTGARIKDYAVIGSEGFGFEIDEHGHPVRIPHIGGVQIGDDVEIGACTVIARGTIDDTIIGDHVKIDDRCFVAHNVRIGNDSLVIAGAEISGSVHVGKSCWIGPNACIREGLKIGDRSLVGIGAVVVKDVPENVIVAGNPARIMRQRYEDNE